MKKFLRYLLWSVLSGIGLIAVYVVIFFNTSPQLGAAAQGASLSRMQASPQYQDGIFVNQIETLMDMPSNKILPLMGEYLKEGASREPQETITVVPFSPENFGQSDSGLEVVWFGHSSALIHLEGKTILLDPIFGQRASMFGFLGPKRFDYSQTMTVDLLPDVDAVLISHDHYDHLDYPTIKALAEKVPRFFVGLGVGAHLEHWGVRANQITVLDWWQEAKLSDELQVVFTPTRHFSGRGLTDRFSTLWGSWVIKGQTQRAYFSGDSGYFPGFKEIGALYGPFDLAMMECGAYNEAWGEIHMMPEQTAQASVDVQAVRVMPIHWGKFNLSLHPWKEPIERLQARGATLNLNILTPEVGQVFVIPEDAPKSNWWESYE